MGGVRHAGPKGSVFASPCEDGFIVPEGPKSRKIASRVRAWAHGGRKQVRYGHGPQAGANHREMNSRTGKTRVMDNEINNGRSVHGRQELGRI